MILRISLLLCFMASCYLSQGQEKVFRTFKDTRVINTPSVETLPKRKLDIRIGHRFGDLAGDNGGWESFYGFENATDVLIGANYGISDRIMIGIARNKGAGPLKQLVTFRGKGKVLEQKTGGAPLTIALSATAVLSTMTKSTNPSALNYFDNSAHRWSYIANLAIARKFSEGFSLQVTPTFLHRNVVNLQDENSSFALAGSARLQLSKVLGLILDATYHFSDYSTSANGFHMPLGVGFEIDTGGHVFQINLTNAQGMVQTDYIPFTTAEWGEGQFRLGFTISRMFNL